MSVRLFKGLFASAAVMAVTLVCWSGALAHELPEGFTGFEDPSYCGTCHEAIYNEWSGSMHAKSSVFSDPLHAAVHKAFSKAMEASGKKSNYHCANCHTPTADNMAALMKGEKEPDPGDPTNTAGVTCSFCHRVVAVVEGEKFHSYRLTDEIMGPFGESDESHGVTEWAFNEPYEMCLGCHGKKVGGKGGVICSMEEEGITDCQPCHMPETAGAPGGGSTRKTHAFHGIHGAHDAGMLEEGATAGISVVGRELIVTLNNPNPHYFPSTNPLRVAYVKVEAMDTDGKVVFENFKSDPTEDPGAMLVKLFGAGGKVGVPSWEAESVAKDTRLAPGETRTLKYSLPESASKARAVLYYRFVPAGAIAKFGITPDGVVDVPHVVSEAEISM